MPRSRHTQRGLKFKHRAYCGCTLGQCRHLALVQTTHASVSTQHRYRTWLRPASPRVVCAYATYVQIRSGGSWHLELCTVWLAGMYARSRQHYAGRMATQPRMQGLGLPHGHELALGRGGRSRDVVVDAHALCMQRSNCSVTAELCCVLVNGRLLGTCWLASRTCV